MTRRSIWVVIQRCRRLQHGHSEADAIQEAQTIDLMRQEGCLPNKSYEAEDSPLLMAPEREDRAYLPLD